MKAKKYFLASGIMFVLFLIFTLMLTRIDVKPVGPMKTCVGLSTLNVYMHKLIGVRLVWYDITDWLGLAAIAEAFAFGVLGLVKLIKRKGLRKVDRRLLMLGGLYVLIFLFYVFFETVLINCRPVLLNAYPEASYPSSHTMIVSCIMLSGARYIRCAWPRRKKLCLASDALAAIIVFATVAGRIVSGVHWLSDILGGLLLSSALLLLYCGGCEKCCINR